MSLWKQTISQARRFQSRLIDGETRPKSARADSNDNVSRRREAGVGKRDDKGVRGLALEFNPRSFPFAFDIKTLIERFIERSISVINSKYFCSIYKLFSNENCLFDDDVLFACHRHCIKPER